MYFFIFKNNAFIKYIMADKKPRCGLCNKKIPLMPMTCNKCNVVFCMEHRFPESHTCKKIEAVITLPPAITFAKLQKI